MGGHAGAGDSDLSGGRSRRDDLRPPGRPFENEGRKSEDHERDGENADRPEEDRRDRAPALAGRPSHPRHYDEENHAGSGAHHHHKQGFQPEIRNQLVNDRDGDDDARHADRIPKDGYLLGCQTEPAFWIEHRMPLPSDMDDGSGRRASRHFLVMASTITIRIENGCDKFQAG